MPVGPHLSRTPTTGRDPTCRPRQRRAGPDDPRANVDPAQATLRIPRSTASAQSDRACPRRQLPLPSVWPPALRVADLVVVTIICPKLAKAWRPIILPSQLHLPRKGDGL